MKELEILLARQRADPGTVRVLPVRYGITYRQCCNLQTVYHGEKWVGGELKPAQDVLDRWANTVRELLSTTAVRDDQVGMERLLKRMLQLYENSILTVYSFNTHV